MFILLNCPLLPFSPVKFYDPLLTGSAVRMWQVLGAESRTSVVRGTVTEDLETSMGTKMPSSLQNRKMFFWERRLSNETQHWPPSALRSREGTPSDGSKRGNPGVFPSSLW